jgi:hypothetical protein
VYLSQNEILEYHNDSTIPNRLKDSDTLELVPESELYAVSMDYKLDSA